MSRSEIKISLLSTNALKVNVDVLALKYAQANYGLDTLVSKMLINEGKDPSLMQPKPGDCSLVKSVSSIAASSILFVGVVPLFSFRYAEIRDFSRRALSFLAKSSPYVRRIAITLHGAEYGLDENEAFESEVAGLVDAIRGLDFPEALEELVIVEINRERARRLEGLLDQLLPSGVIFTATRERIEEIRIDSDRLRTAGYSSSTKRHIFVAMPFKEEMDDIYHYGIQGAVRNAGFLCERADISSFTGDVMKWVRERIKTASLVVADLTEANPNVYLEVGYAWGCGIPTVLLVKNSDHLKFDTQGQRCLLYKRIKDLEKYLTKELKALKDKGVI